MLRELLTRVPDIRAAGPPDRLLSSFINGVKHLPCDVRRLTGSASAGPVASARSARRSAAAPVQRVEVPGQGHVGGGQAAGGVG